MLQFQFQYPMLMNIFLLLAILIQCQAVGKENRKIIKWRMYLDFSTNSSQYNSANATLKY